jgi:hypothetical protein
VLRRYLTTGRGPVHVASSSSVAQCLSRSAVSESVAASKMEGRWRWGHHRHAGWWNTVGGARSRLGFGGLVNLLQMRRWGVTVGGSAAGASAVGVDYRLQAAGVGRAGGVVPGRSWRMMRWRKKEAGGGVGEARGSQAVKAQRCARTNDVSCSRNDGN